MNKFKPLRSAVNAPEYSPEEKITSWAKIVRTRLENGKEVFVPELAQEIYSNHSHLSQIKARAIVLSLKSKIEGTSDMKLLRCHAPSRYMLVDDSVNTYKEHGKRAKVTGSYINSVKRSFESIDVHNPAMMLQAKQMVWDLENHLRDIETKSLGGAETPKKLTAETKTKRKYVRKANGKIVEAVPVRIKRKYTRRSK